MTAPVIYPTFPGLDIKVVWRPKAVNFAPQIHASGREVLVSSAQYPLHEFELVYNVIRNTSGYTELTQMMGFFLQSAGVLNGFLFQNPYDNAVTGNVIGTGDGTTTTFVLTRTFGSGGFTGTEPIGYLNSGVTLNVYVNGVLQTLTTNYTVDQTYPGKQTITFVTAPAAAAVISIDAGYYYFCRFSADTLDFNQVLYDVFQIKRVTLVSKRGPF